MNLSPCHYKFAAQLERDHNAAYGKKEGTRLAKRYLAVIAKIPARPNSKLGGSKQRSPTEERILDALAERPMTKRELADITVKTIGQVGIICQKLETQGQIRTKKIAGTVANLYEICR